MDSSNNLELKPGQMFYCNTSYAKYPVSLAMRAIEVVPPFGEIEEVIAIDSRGMPYRIYANEQGVELKKMSWWDRMLKYSSFPKEMKRRIKKNGRNGSLIYEDLNPEEYSIIPPRRKAVNLKEIVNEDFKLDIPDSSQL